jgi:hypothetical protein
MAEEAGARTSTAPQGVGETHAVATDNAGRLPSGSGDATATGDAVIENAAPRQLFNR